MARQNAVEAGELVSTSEVLARVLAAASVLRMGHENARRNVEVGVLRIVPRPSRGDR